MQDVYQVSCVIVGLASTLRRFQFRFYTISSFIPYTYSTLAMDAANDNKVAGNMILYDEVITGTGAKTHFLSLSN